MYLTLLSSTSNFFNYTLDYILVNLQKVFNSLLFKKARILC